MDKGGGGLLEEVGLTAGLLDTLLLGLRQLADVAVHGILHPPKCLVRPSYSE